MALTLFNANINTQYTFAVRGAQLALGLLCWLLLLCFAKGTAKMVADLRMDYPASGPLSLHYAEGNKISRADYAPRTKVFDSGEKLHFEPSGGRSSSEAFPFYNIESKASGQGVMMAI